MNSATDGTRVDDARPVGLRALVGDRDPGFLGHASRVRSRTRQVQPFPGEVHQSPGGGIVTSKLDDVINWARSNSLWPLVFGTSCCAIEMMSTASAKYDFSRFGFEVTRATPRQADVIIISGTIVNKMAPVLKRLYDQMADPKYVIAMGACATSGGPFFYNTYSVVKGADHVIPVDVYVAGCPPRPEALLHALITLQQKIKAGATREQIRKEGRLTAGK